MLISLLVTVLILVLVLALVLYLIDLLPPQTDPFKLWAKIAVLVIAIVCALSLLPGLGGHPWFRCP